MAANVSAAWALVIYGGQTADTFGDEPPQKKANPTTPHKDASRRDLDADRKLLSELQTAIDASADHLDHSRVDRELAAAFRGFGLDLDVVDPKSAGARLAGRATTPEIAAAIDAWCRVRKTALGVPTWRRLAEVARAADPDPWRNALRDQYDKQPADALPVVRAKAADLRALEKQPANSLLMLFSMLLDSDDQPTAATVIRVAERLSG